MFYSERRQKARKSHQCFHCYRHVKRGEEYSRQFVVDGGDHWVIKYHLDCDKLSQKFNAETDLYGFYDDDGVPPVYDSITDSGDFGAICDEYRGRFPHAVTRLEYTGGRYEPDGSEFIDE